MCKTKGIFGREGLGSAAGPWITVTDEAEGSRVKWKQESVLSQDIAVMAPVVKPNTVHSV
jgi:hypothetical protein